jgi:hypothetical protein
MLTNSWATLEPFVEPARYEEFQFTRAWLRGRFNRINDIRDPDFVVGMKLNLPPSYALIHRVWLGGIGVLCQLQSTIPMRAELERWVPGFSRAGAWLRRIERPAIERPAIDRA